MAYEIIMPRLGWNMEEGTLVEWLIKEGEPVQKGDLVCTIEGDKATLEIESFEAGILRIPPGAPPPGATVPVGTLLGYVVSEAEKDTFDMTGAVSAKDVASDPPPDTAEPLPEIRRRREETAPAISPRAFRIAAELGVDWRNLIGSSRSGRIVERDIRAAAGEIDTRPRKTYKSDRETVVYEDIPETTQESGQIDRIPEMRGVPMGSIRRTIAHRMAVNMQTSAPVTLTTEADVTALVRLRDRLRREQDTRAPAYHDMLAKIVASALGDYPEVNASLDGDTIFYHDRVNIGIATETDRGLLVPVVRDVENKSLAAVAAETADLIEQTRTGVVSIEHLQGGTFTITNLGMYDIDGFTPIINLPECAILGVGRIVPKVIVIDEETATTGIRKMMTLSLTFDHRLVDGGPAARFLQQVKELIEQPDFLS